MMRPTLVTLSFALATPAWAIDFAVEARGWTVSATEDGCAMYQEFEGPGSTQMLYARNLEGKRILSLVNSNWSTVPKQQYDFELMIDNNVYGGGTSVGFQSSGVNGFVSPVPAQFDKDLAAGSTLRIYLQEKLVDRLSLDGTAAALAAIDQCMGKWQAAQAAERREKARWADITQDPFAPPPRINAPAVPIGDGRQWLTRNDYPFAARNGLQQGRVGYTVSVASDGRAAKCAVTESSKWPDLDARTCELIMARSRFEPATDSEGKATVGSWNGSFEWSLYP